MKDLNQRFNPKKARSKTQWRGDVGRLIDCEIAEGSTLANLGHYPPNIPVPLVLRGGIYAREKF